MFCNLTIVIHDQLTLSCKEHGYRLGVLRLEEVRERLSKVRERAFAVRIFIKGRQIYLQNEIATNRSEKSLKRIELSQLARLSFATVKSKTKSRNPGQMRHHLLLYLSSASRMRLTWARMPPNLPSIGLSLSKQDTKTTEFETRS
jgi:hypothetical protein